MNDLWKIVDQVAKSHTQMVVNASLRELSDLVVKQASEAGLSFPPPSTSHMKYILERLGYELPEKGSHKGFVYKWKENHE